MQMEERTVSDLLKDYSDLVKLLDARRKELLKDVIWQQEALTKAATTLFAHVPPAIGRSQVALNFLMAFQDMSDASKISPEIFDERFEKFNAAMLAFIELAFQETASNIPKIIQGKN
jgi:hypothetical protein